MMMRFPTQLIYSEVNYKLRSENVYNAFATIILRIELALKQAAAYASRSIKYDHNEQDINQKFQDNSIPLRMWLDSFLNNGWIGRSKDIMPFHSFKYCTIAATKYNLENKVVSTKISMFPCTAEEAKDCEN